MTGCWHTPVTSYERQSSTNKRRTRNSQFHRLYQRGHHTIDCGVVLVDINGSNLLISQNPLQCGDRLCRWHPRHHLRLTFDTWTSTWPRRSMAAQWRSLLLSSLSSELTRPNVRSLLWLLFDFQLFVHSMIPFGSMMKQLPFHSITHTSLGQPIVRTKPISLSAHVTLSFFRHPQSSVFVCSHPFQNLLRNRNSPC